MCHEPLQEVHAMLRILKRPTKSPIGFAKARPLGSHPKNSEDYSNHLLPVGAQLLCKL